MDVKPSDNFDSTYARLFMPIFFVFVQIKQQNCKTIFSCIYSKSVSYLHRRLVARINKAEGGNLQHFKADLKLP